MQRPKNGAKWKHEYPSQIGVRLTKRDVDKLRQLCEARDCYPSQMVRRLIRIAALPKKAPA